MRTPSSLSRPLSRITLLALLLASVAHAESPADRARECRFGSCPRSGDVLWERADAAVRRGQPARPRHRDPATWTTLRGRVFFNDLRVPARDYAHLPGSRWFEPPLYTKVTDEDPIRPLRHAVVRIWDHDPEGLPDLIGEAVTSVRGTFRFQFRWDEVRALRPDDAFDLTEEAPDLFVTVHLEGVLPFLGDGDWDLTRATVHEPGEDLRPLFRVTGFSEERFTVPSVDTKMLGGGIVQDAGPGTHWLLEGEPLIFGRVEQLDIETEIPDDMTLAANVFAYLDAFFHRMTDPAVGLDLMTPERLLLCWTEPERCSGHEALEVRIVRNAPWAARSFHRCLLSVNARKNAMRTALYHELGHWFIELAVDRAGGLRCQDKEGSCSLLLESFAEFFRVVLSWDRDAGEPISPHLEDWETWEETAPCPEGVRARQTRARGRAFWDLHDLHDDHDAEGNAYGERASHGLEDFWATWQLLADTVELSEVSMKDWWEAWSSQHPEWKYEHHAILRDLNCLGEVSNLPKEP
ncbi:MAG: hypothetical protein AAF533_24185 [Acidobacteriota bacterium]